jgi:hypothetical protein
MEVHFTPEVQAKLDRMERESGCSIDELVVAAVVNYLDVLARSREMLDRRYDEMEGGKVKPINGDEFFRRLMEKTEAKRQQSA